MDISSPSLQFSWVDDVVLFRVGFRSCTQMLHLWRFIEEQLHVSRPWCSYVVVAAVISAVVSQAEVTSHTCTHTYSEIGVRSEHESRTDWLFVLFLNSTSCDCGTHDAMLWLDISRCNSQERHRTWLRSLFPLIGSVFRRIWVCGVELHLDWRMWGFFESVTCLSCFVPWCFTCVSASRKQLFQAAYFIFSVNIVTRLTAGSRLRFESAWKSAAQQTVRGRSMVVVRPGVWPAGAWTDLIRHIWSLRLIEMFFTRD